MKIKITKHDIPNLKGIFTSGLHAQLANFFATHDFSDVTALEGMLKGRSLIAYVVKHCTIDPTLTIYWLIQHGALVSAAERSLWEGVFKSNPKYYDDPVFVSEAKTASTSSSSSSSAVAAADSKRLRTMNAGAHERKAKARLSYADKQHSDVETDDGFAAGSIDPTTGTLINASKLNVGNHVWVKFDRPVRWYEGYVIAVSAEQVTVLYPEDNDCCVHFIDGLPVKLIAARPSTDKLIYNKIAKQTVLIRTDGQITHFPGKIASLKDLPLLVPNSTSSSASTTPPLSTSAASLTPIPAMQPKVIPANRGAPPVMAASASIDKAPVQTASMPTLQTAQAPLMFSMPGLTNIFSPLPFPGAMLTRPTQVATTVPAMSMAASSLSTLANAAASSSSSSSSTTAAIFATQAPAPALGDKRKLILEEQQQRAAKRGKIAERLAAMDAERARLEAEKAKMLQEQADLAAKEKADAAALDAMDKEEITQYMKKAAGDLKTHLEALLEAHQALAKHRREVVEKQETWPAHLQEFARQQFLQQNREQGMPEIAAKLHSHHERFATAFPVAKAPVATSTSTGATVADKGPSSSSTGPKL